MVATLPKRSEVPVEKTWDASSIFATPEDWQKAVEEVNRGIPELNRHAGKLAGTSRTLLEALKERDDLIVKAGHIYQWAMMHQAVDSDNQQAIARLGQAQMLFARVQAAAAYIEPEILEMEPQKLDALMSESEDLAVYRHYFDKLGTRRGHVRSAEVEQVLAEVSDVAQSGYFIYNALADADLKFGKIKDEEGREVELGQSNVWQYIRSQNREVREAAWNAMSDAYIAFKNTCASTLNSAVKSDVFYSRARNYDSALEASLSATNIPTQVFYQVLDTFKKNLPVWHRYWEIKRRGLGVDRLTGYDIDVPLVRSSREIPYDEGMNMVLEGMAPLGNEYLEPLRKGLMQERWVDVLPNQGKGQGAFSSGFPGTHPFLFISYDNSLENVSTLAHELGHSMHSFLTWKNQPVVYGGYSMFVAETASNFNQALMRANLLSKNPDEDFELEILAEAMSNFHRYLFIMPTLARFEIECHERVERGESLTAESMMELMADLYAEAYGPAVDIDRPRVGITWAEFPHLFANFYVFQYTTGISAANALADMVVKEGKPAADRYLSFLRAGDSLYPIDALKLAGIDMSTPEPVERAFGILNGMVDRLDKLVGEGPISR